MPVIEQLLNWGPVFLTRRNHAMEHATLQVLAEKFPALRAAGYSDPKGFWMIGNIETSQLEQAIWQAAARMQRGEHSLAVHPYCGTNLVTSAFLAGSAAWLAMLGAGKSWRGRIERWPLVVSLVMIAMVAAQPVGPLLQEHLTTSSATQGFEILSIQHSKRGDTTVHRILTRYR